jgi:hypothetical protein
MGEQSKDRPPRRPILCGVTDTMWRTGGDTSLVIRTDFAHDDEWAELRAAVVAPQTAEEFAANVAFVDDRANEGLTPAALLKTVPADADHGFAFLADELTLTHPDRPVLVVNLYDGEDAGTTFRVVPAEMWSVQNNLSLANMDWDEFAGGADDDGIFRGFA